SFVVLVEDRHSGLQNDRAGIEVLIHKMDSAAGELDAVLQRLPLRFEAGERRQQRRMNIQNTVRKLRHEVVAQQVHNPTQADQINLLLVQNGDDLAVVRFALQAFRWNQPRIEATLLRFLQTLRVRAVGDYDGDLSVRNLSAGDVVRNRHEVR